jgi:hypothetical protein
MAGAPSADGPAARFFGVGGPVFMLGVFAPVRAVALTAGRRPRRWGDCSRASAGGGGARWYHSRSSTVIIKLVAALIHRVARTHGHAGDTPWFRWRHSGIHVGPAARSAGEACVHASENSGSQASRDLLGVMWPWHLPLFFIPGTGGQSFPIYRCVTALSVAWHALKTGAACCW